MGKYTSAESDIFSIFGSTEWIAENIATYPANFTTQDSGEFLRVSVIPSGKAINRNSLSGILIIDIFITAGVGPNRINVIADLLDAYLANKSVETVAGYNTQFADSAIGTGKQDKDNPSLYIASYTIPFNYYGVL